MLSAMIFVIGIFAGMMLLALIKSRNMNLSWKIVQPFLLPAVMILVALYLIVMNWSIFVHAPSIGSWHALQTVLLKNPANETVILFGVFFGLLGILSYVIRIPLSNWQQIKLFGLFEATRVKEEAKDQFQAFRKLEWDRMTALGTMASELGIRIVQERMAGLDLDAESVLNTLCEAIVNCYDIDEMKASISTGHFDRIRTIELSLPSLVEEAIRIPQVVPVRGNWGSAMVVPICFGNANYVVWFHSINYTFTETDTAFVEAMVNILESNFERALIQEYIEEVGATDEP
ncbi:hypothetical protein [Sulfoacidibacillus ferrooxidans]|uniref:Uncharacterized protein n=1 Tax=Sulfoacidibacillus ferrooxidans TaxID=2005001 RepID=A0A9X1VB89_9BACL|nr:hypothetical protein [Sulfoacidibacillus ferrooxidans]MCI0184560.1 hypothetical protein [Sulfoacidibacillus ferrooxidans]